MEPMSPFPLPFISRNKMKMIFGTPKNKAKGLVEYSKSIYRADF